MKTKLLKLSCFALLIFIFLGCGENEKKTNIETSKITDSETILSDFTNYRPERETVVLTNNDTRRQSSERYKVEGDFNIKNNLINVSIPITDNDLDIVDVLNISSRNINTILILLDGSKGLSTPQSPITSIIETKIKISELNLNKRRLKNHKKIKIVVYNNNTFNSEHLKGFKKCIKKQKGYSRKKCGITIKNNKFNLLRPDEEGGDIIVGG